MLQADLKTTRLVMRSPNVGDAVSFLNFYRRNASFLSPWENIPKLEEASFREVLKSWGEEQRAGTSVRFFLFLRENRTLIGLCNFSQIFHGYFQACYLGYKIDQDYEGKGLMFEALKHTIPFMFNEIGLHRIMANYLPQNVRSAHLLERLGFEIEGMAKNYLLINDRWEDHVLTSLTKERWLSSNL